MGCYKSCNCRRCKQVPSSVKRIHKAGAHRALRRAAKKAIRNGTEPPAAVATGYKD